MLLQMAELGVFQGLLNHLARGKAARSDDVPNELLQALATLAMPCKLQEAMRRLLVVICLAGHTSDESRVSNTASQYMKGFPLYDHSQNWRPLALAKLDCNQEYALAKWIVYALANLD